MSDMSAILKQAYQEAVVEEAEQDMDAGNYDGATQLLNEISVMPDSFGSGTGSGMTVNYGSLSDAGSTGDAGGSLGAIVADLENVVQELESYENLNSEMSSLMGGNSNPFGSLNSFGNYNTNSTLDPYALLNSNSGLGSSGLNAYGTSTNTNTSNPFSLNNELAMEYQLAAESSVGDAGDAGYAGDAGLNYGSNGGNSNEANWDRGFIAGFETASQGAGNWGGTQNMGGTQVNSFDANSWGDPHLDATVNGNHSIVNQENTDAHGDLIDANRSIQGGFNVGTKETAISGGVDFNNEVDTHMGGKNVSVTLNSGSAGTVKIGNETLAPGSSVSWKDGGSSFTVTQGTDGKVTESATNSEGGSVQSVITNDGSGKGLNVDTSGSNVIIGGFLGNEAVDAQTPAASS